MGWLFGKSRSKLGKWIDARKISQEQLSRKSGVSNSTLGDLCNGKSDSPQKRTSDKIIKALKELTGEDVGRKDFWA